MRKRFTGAVAAAVFLLLALIWSQADPARHHLLLGAGILAASVSLWICGTLPMSVTTLLMIALLALTKIVSFRDAIAQFSVSTSLFILASACLTAAIRGSALPQRMTGALMRRFAGREKALVFCLGILITLCSAFMSSLATCAMFAALMREFMEQAGLPQHSRFRRDVMLLIPACAGIGGFMSPAGTPANILLLELLAAQGARLSFLQWCAIGFPLGLGASALFLGLLLLLSPPEEIALRPDSGRQPFTARDRKVAVITAAVIGGWFLSGWLPGLDVTIVGLLGMIAIFSPGIDLLSWRQFEAETDWDLVIMMGTVSVLMSGIASTGLLSRAAALLVSALSGLSGFAFLAALSVILFLLRTCIPTTTAVPALIGPLLLEISAARGISAVPLLMLLAFWTAAALILVYTEPIYLITFHGGKAYSARDLARVGIPVSLLMALVLAAGMPPLVQLVLG